MKIIGHLDSDHQTSELAIVGETTQEKIRLGSILALIPEASNISLLVVLPSGKTEGLIIKKFRFSVAPTKEQMAKEDKGAKK